MDAATLYIVLKMTDGSQTTATYNYDTIRECRAGADFIRSVQQANTESPIISLRCEPRRNTAYHMYCDWPSRCDDTGPLTHEGCTALQWITHMRDRSLTTTCWHDRNREGEDPYAPKKEPEVPDRFDERGMPGMKQ